MHCHLAIAKKNQIFSTDGQSTDHEAIRLEIVRPIENPNGLRQSQLKQGDTPVFPFTCRPKSFRLHMIKNPYALHGFRRIR